MDLAFSVCLWSLISCEFLGSRPISSRVLNSTSQETREAISSPRLLLLSGTFSRAYRLPSLLTPPVLQLALSGHHSGPPEASSKEDGSPFPMSHPHGQRYLVLEFSILEEPQLILTIQIISINVAEVYLKTERVHLDHQVVPTVPHDNLHVPG